MIAKLTNSSRYWGYGIVVDCAGMIVRFHYWDWVVLWKNV